MIIRHNSIPIFGINLSIYGLSFLLGFAVAILTAIPKVRKYRLKKLEIVTSAVFAGVGGVVGAKLLSILTTIPLIIENHLSFVEVMQGGFVFYGGLIGGALGLFLYCIIFKVPFAKYSDLYAAGVALGHSFGRVGCLLSGCCYGMETSGPFYVIYESSVDPNTPLNTPLLPIQLIEIFCLLAIFIACEIVFYRTKRPGNSALVYAMSYSVARFVLEFFRGDAIRGVAAGLSTSQYISFAIFLLCYAILFVRLLQKYGVIKLRPPKAAPAQADERKEGDPPSEGA